MKNYIEERVLELATFILEQKATVRRAAKEYGISKSTVHKDVTERLYHINKSLSTEIRKILDINKAERHIRGGQATKAKFQGNPYSVET